MNDSLERLYRTKLTLLATILLSAGLVILVGAHWADHVQGLRWLDALPLSDIGSGLFTTGLLGVALQYFDAQDSETRATERLKHVLAETAPAMRDAVISGFAFEPAELARVATPRTLDQIATNALGIRLQDQAFAAAIYSDLSRQAIDLPERLSDVRVSIRLSGGRPVMRHRTPRFEATVRWEYTTVPVHQTRRFVALADRNEFREVAGEGGATSAWLINPRPGMEAADRDAFELTSFTVDGVARPIRRSSKADSQTYTVSLGDEVVKARLPVPVAYTYRTLVSRDGHLLQLRADQPSHGVTFELDYSDTDLAAVTVLDFIASSDRSRITASPSNHGTKIVSVDFDGWVFPRSGVAFIW